MLHLQNKELRKYPSERGKGLAGTIIIHLVLLLVLVFVSFSVPPPPEFEEGIEVNFGTGETGLGDLEPSPVTEQVEAVPPPPSNESVQAEEEPLLTQNDEKAPEVKKIDPEAEKKKKELAGAERIKREALETERKRKELEETERKKIEAEQQRQADIMNRTKNALAGSKNAGSTSISEGVAGGPGNQGTTSGSVDSKVRGDGGGTGTSGISYDLGGRGLQEELPNPEYFDYQEPAIVIVEIRVNRDGKVIQATPGKPGSTTLEGKFLDAAKKAALKAQFKPDPAVKEIQVGTITYTFKLK